MRLTTLLTTRLITCAHDRRARSQENRFLTDLRTGAAGAVSVKYLSTPKHDQARAVIRRSCLGAYGSSMTDAHGSENLPPPARANFDAVGQHGCLLQSTRTLLAK